MLMRFINRTEIVFDQIKKFSESVVKLEWNVRDMNYSMRKTFADVRHVQKATVLYQNLLPMVLEEELGWVILQYLQCPVPPERTVVDGPCPTGSNQTSLKTAYPRFRAAFSSLSFYYDKSKPMFTYRDNQLTVYVRIPVISGEHLFRVYEVLSLPVPINMGGVQKDALQIVGLPSDVAVSLTR